MSLTAVVTPGKQFANDEAITNAKLNQLGQPTVNVTGTFAQLTDFNSVVAVTKTFTLLDATADTITATAHGITAPVSIDDVRQVFLTTSGTLPAGLTSSAKYGYFARVIDANTLTLHTTVAGALSGADRVDITSAGTGVHTLSYSPFAVGAALIYNAATGKFEKGIVHPANLPDVIGASATAPGARGAAPAPKAGDQAKFLRGDGTWTTPPVDSSNILSSWKLCF